jgi:hypothetical protein
MSRIVSAILIVVGFATFGPSVSRAALRESLDQRAVQWSTLIVRARLTDIGSLLPLPATVPGSAGPGSKTDAAFAFRIYHFEITEVLDGVTQKSQPIAVARVFSSTAGTETGSPVHFSDSIGKSFILLLHPISDLAIGSPKDKPKSPAPARAIVDPRLAGLGDRTLAIVYAIANEEVTPDSLADLTHLIKDVRANEAKFSYSNATLQARTLAQASDQTEAEQAAHALGELGFKALPIIISAYNAANEVGRARLEPVIHDMELPPLVAVSPDEN